MFKVFSIKTEVKKPSKFLKIYLETSQEDNFHRNLSRGDYSSKPLKRRLFIETSPEAKTIHRNLFGGEKISLKPLRRQIN